MITFTKSYKTSGGQVFSTIEEAQHYEIEKLFHDNGEVLNSSNTLTQFVLKNKDRLVDILTTTPNSKPKARSVNGGSKKRMAKVIITDADTSIMSKLNELGETQDGKNRRVLTEAISDAKKIYMEKNSVNVITDDDRSDNK